MSIMIENIDQYLLLHRYIIPYTSTNIKQVPISNYVIRIFYKNTIYESLLQYIINYNDQYV